MRAVRFIQTVSIAAVLIAASAALVVSAHATERHDDTHSTHREQQRDSREYPHIHAPRERYEHPPLHSEGTREDRDSYPSFDDPDDYLERQRLQQLTDEPEDE